MLDHAQTYIYIVSVLVCGQNVAPSPPPLPPSPPSTAIRIIDRASHSTRYIILINTRRWF